jgi:peptidoglycan/xylan/chitin deacetylase (PgdA/CDA1 family)
VAGLLVTTALTAATPLGRTIDVAGVRVPAEGIETVGDALAVARVEVGSGRYVAAVSGRELVSRPTPGQVFVDGRPATLSTQVRGGDVVAVVPGKDRREPLVTVQVPLPSRGEAALYVGGRPAEARVVRGALSGETVSRRLVHGPGRGRLVAPGALALTFDDGPDPRWTPRVLSLLSHYHVRATFCVVGRHVDEHPELVRAIVARGHLLCNHTYDHDEALTRRPPAVVAAQIARTQAAVLRAAGVRPTLFRAPGGFWSPSVVQAARAQGLAPLKWTADPRDWARPGVKTILHTLLSELRAGRIVLLHDGGGDRLQTLKAVSWMLRELPRRGYSFQLPTVPS